MNSCWLVEGKCVGRCPELIEPNRHSGVGLFTRKMQEYGTSCTFILRAWESIKPASCVPVVVRWSWAIGPRNLVAVELSLCPSTFQDLAESGPLEPEAAPVSKLATRTARLPTICSALVILVVRTDTVWESDSTQFSILDTFCKSSGSCK